MNILPKKSWHVRTKKNIERVRRDEEKAAEEEKERQRRIALAEQEARTEQLRQRSRKRGHDQIEAPSSSSAAAIEASSSETDNKLVKASAAISLDQGGHINFFKDIEEGLRREGKNKEHEAEKAAEKEKWEKNIGLLTYLGQSSVEAQNDKPWYLQKTEKKVEGQKGRGYEALQSKREDRDRKLKDSMDPLKDMKRHLEKRHKHKDKHRSKEKSGHSSRPKQDKQPQSSGSSLAPPKKGKTVEELRAERLRREAAERQKVAAVMARARGETCGPADDGEGQVSDADRDRSRGYNSRYNPHFVKPLPPRRR
ncbi:leukocyte receptor cluster member 1 homolog [Babylonia areolata]|uniref:leukocyte receptor cluster member 1 homolog n=1 Tax=Babylonia areolata TaxID=304850 RepID=UPI003FCEF669